MLHLFFFETSHVRSFFSLIYEYFCGAISQRQVRDSGYLADVEIQAEIDECFAYADALRDRGIDARVVVEAVDREESETGARGPVKVRVERVTHPVMPEDIPKLAQEGVVEVTYRYIVRFVIQSSMITHSYPSPTKMHNTRSRASMTHEEVEELVTPRVTEVMEAREAARTLEPLNENGDEQEGENGGNGNGGNGGNGKGRNGENERTIGVDATYAMNWAGLMRLMTEVYCPRNEIQKMETELWNLTVKGNDLTAYTQRFQELFV
ncbi:putative reverse transcriptase domain-containing protein [Tanacetum coccineum]